MKRTAAILISAGFLAGFASHAFAAERGDDQRSSTEKRISLNVEKGDIRTALQLVAEQGELNISIGPGVEGEVSVFLTEASLEAALRAIAEDNGFVFTVRDGIISVSKPPEYKEGEGVVPPLLTEIFTLRYRDAERVRDALEFALTKHGKMKVLNENSLKEYLPQRLGDLAGELGENGDSSTNGGTNGGSNNTGLNTNVNSEEVGAPRNARILVVTDVAENVSRIADLVADLDKRPPQVLIEARIIEISTDLQRELGIDWDINVLANGPILNHELPLQWEAGFASGGQIRRTPNGTPRASAGLALGTIDFSQLTSLLRIHQSDNAIRLLANPRLLVMHNHSASILVGERFPIFDSTITDQGTVTESLDTYIPIGVQLEVTPTILANQQISMTVHPVTSSLGDPVVGTTGLVFNRINTRELSTRVLMSDGQTIVLGGLISDRKERTVNKVPGLGDLPILNLFTRQEIPQVQRVDLLVFLTAHVEGSTEMSERDREVFDRYRPQFKQIDRLQDVPLHFEVPSEYERIRPMFGDPPHRVRPTFEPDRIRHRPIQEPPAPTDETRIL
ncbi:MAG: type II secretion system protein GspD, partial [Phycisphaerae bacterium]